MESGKSENLFKYISIGSLVLMVGYKLLTMLLSGWINDPSYSMDVKIYTVEIVFCLALAVALAIFDVRSRIFGVLVNCFLFQIELLLFDHEKWIFARLIVCLITYALIFFSLGLFNDKVFKLVVRTGWALLTMFSIVSTLVISFDMNNVGLGTLIFRLAIYICLVITMALTIPALKPFFKISRFIWWLPAALLILSAVLMGKPESYNVISFVRGHLANVIRILSMASFCFYIAFSKSKRSKNTNPVQK